MADITIHEEFRVDGVLTNLDSTPKLSNAAATYGVKRNDTDAVVVADDTTFDTHVSTGIYEHTFTEPALNLNYTYWVEWVYGGQTYRDEHVISLAGVITLSDLKDICKYHGWNDTTTTGMAACARFINRTLQLLAKLAPWPEYHKRDGSIAMADADADYTLSQKNIQQFGILLRSTSPTPLKEISGGVERWMVLNKVSSQMGMPTQYTLLKSVDSSGDILTELLVYPTPTTVETLYYSYRILPAKLTADSDVTDWPDSRMWLLDEALDMRIASGKRDTAGVALEGGDFMAKVRLAMRDSRISYMPLPTMDIENMRDKTIREVPFQVA